MRGWMKNVAPVISARFKGQSHGSEARYKKDGIKHLQLQEHHYWKQSVVLDTSERSLADKGYLETRFSNLW